MREVPAGAGASASTLVEMVMDNYKKMTVSELIQKFMLEANEHHVEGRHVQSFGFVVFPEGSGKTGCSFLHAGRPVKTPEALRRFAVAVRALTKNIDGSVAGIVCDLAVSLEGATPSPSILIYVDQKFGGLRVWIAPKVEGALVFRDMGDAHPGTNHLLPQLFSPESYGPAAEA